MKLGVEGLLLGLLRGRILGGEIVASGKVDNTLTTPEILGNLVAVVDDHLQRGYEMGDEAKRKNKGTLSLL